MQVLASGVVQYVFNATSKSTRVSSRVNYIIKVAPAPQGCVLTGFTVRLFVINTKSPSKLTRTIMLIKDEIFNRQLIR